MTNATAEIVELEHWRPRSIRELTGCIVDGYLVADPASDIVLVFDARTGRRIGAHPW